jgi:transposase
MTCGPGSPGTP